MSMSPAFPEGHTSRVLYTIPTKILEKLIDFGESICYNIFYTFETFQAFKRFSI